MDKLVRLFCPQGGYDKVTVKEKDLENMEVHYEKIEFIKA